MKDVTLYTLLHTYVHFHYTIFDYEFIKNDITRNDYFHESDLDKILLILKEVVEEINNNF